MRKRKGNRVYEICNSNICQKHFEAKRVLQDIDFTFESGKIYGLLGRNGAGKTTLFNCLNRDIRTDGGQFYLETEEGRREVRPEDIGYVLSTPTVPEFLTGREFLKFFWKSMKNISRTCSLSTRILIM